jgi:hypothetical protein
MRMAISPVRLTLSGSTQLSENIPLGQKTTDRIVMETASIYKLGVPLPQPHVLYNQSPSLLQANFDGCVEVTGALVPKLTASGRGPLRK